MRNISINATGCQLESFNPIVPVIFIFILLISFVLNIMSLWIFWFKIKQWNAMVVLQFNLAISDAIITPALPLMIRYYLTDRWTFGSFLCQLKAFLVNTHFYGSIYFLTIISIHRYLTIAHNTRCQSLTRKAFITKVCIVVWLLLLCQCLPFFFVLETTEVLGIPLCLSFHQKENALFFFVWNTVILITGVLIPFSITLLCYSLLIQYILKVNPMNTFSQVMLTKSVRTISISLIIFLICYIPVHIAQTMGIVIMFYFPSMCSLLGTAEAAYYITWMMSETNCCMDPVLYYFASDKFKNAFLNWCTSLQRHHNTITDCNDNQTEASSHPHSQNHLTDVSSTETGITGPSKMLKTVRAKSRHSNVEWKAEE